MNVKGTIKAIQDIMRTDRGVDGDAQRISQLTWMLFLKVFDAKEEEWELYDGYKPVIPEGLRWRDWATNPEGKTGEALLNFINNELFIKLKELDASDGDRRKLLVREIFEDSFNYMKSGVLLRQVVNRLNTDIDFNDIQERHLFNEIYETILRDLQSAGNAGEFYTPRPVTRFIVEKVGPTLGERVLDPACGTGGFLTCTIERLNSQVKNVEDAATLQKTIMGIEKKPLPYLLATTNLILHGIDLPSIRHANSLLRTVTDYRPEEKVDVVVTNPPFGGAEEPGVEKMAPVDFQTRETADLFLVLIMYLLRDGGRCGLVLPDGFLFGSGVKTAIKKKLLEEFNLHTIIRLPNDVFAPYTNIRTNLLFFTKGIPTKGIWYYRLPMPEGYKHFSKTKPMTDMHFDEVREWWDNRTESDNSMYFPVEDIIKGDYNLDLCSENGEEEELLPPNGFIDHYHNAIIKKQEKIDAILVRIREELGRQE